MEKDKNAYDMHEEAHNAVDMRSTGNADMNKERNILLPAVPAHGADKDSIQGGAAMEKPRMNGYGDIIADMRKRLDVQPGQEEKDRKRQRAMLVLGALSDGIAGMANIFAARKGALPVWHDPVTNELDARYQAVLDERRRRSGYWNDIEARMRMADLNEKLRREQRNAGTGKIQETGYDEYGDGIKLYGAQPADKSIKPEVSHKETTKQYAVNTENNKKLTGINW